MVPLTNGCKIHRHYYSTKILKQVEYESARRKNILMKKQEKEMRKALHFLYVHLPQGTQGNSIYSREALVEVMEGK